MYLHKDTTTPSEQIYRLIHPKARRSSPTYMTRPWWTGTEPAMANHTHPMSDATHARGPLSFLHPTTRYHPVIGPQKQQQHKHPEATSQASSEPPLSREGRPESATPETATPETTTPEDHGARQVYHVWRSRDNRKGRRRAVITGPKGPQSRRVGLVDEEKTQLKKTVRGVSRLFTRFPVWDVTYLVAVSFVLGLFTFSPFHPLLSHASLVTIIYLFNPHFFHSLFLTLPLPRPLFTPPPNPPFLFHLSLNPLVFTSSLSFLLFSSFLFPPSIVPSHSHSLLHSPSSLSLPNRPIILHSPYSHYPPPYPAYSPQPSFSLSHPQDSQIPPPSFSLH